MIRFLSNRRAANPCYPFSCPGLEQFTSSQAYKELNVSTFRKLGLSLPIDGLCDDELSIKGIDSSLLGIGDWREGGLKEDEELLALHSELPGPVEDEPADVAVEYIDRV